VVLFAVLLLSAASGLNFRRLFSPNHVQLFYRLEMKFRLVRRSQDFPVYIFEYEQDFDDGPFFEGLHETSVTVVDGSSGHNSSFIPPLGLTTVLLCRKIPRLQCRTVHYFRPIYMTNFQLPFLVKARFWFMEHLVLRNCSPILVRVMISRGCICAASGARSA